jgi:hypothetical protein
MAGRSWIRRPRGRPYAPAPAAAEPEPATEPDVRPTQGKRGTEDTREELRAWAGTRGTLGGPQNKERNGRHVGSSPCEERNSGTAGTSRQGALGIACLCQVHQAWVRREFRKHCSGALDLSGPCRPRHRRKAGFTPISLGSPRLPETCRPMHRRKPAPLPPRSLALLRLPETPVQERWRSGCMPAQASAKAGSAPIKPGFAPSSETRVQEHWTSRVQAGRLVIGERRLRSGRAGHPGRFRQSATGRSRQLTARDRATGRGEVTPAGGRSASARSPRCRRPWPDAVAEPRRGH